MSNEVGKTLKEAPKIGDRVTLPADYKGGSIWSVSLAGTSGRITHVNGLAANVEFDNGKTDYGSWTALTPESTPAVPDQAAPTHIVIEGVRYALTPEPEDEPEGEPEQKRRTPQAGEVWGDVDGDLMLVFDTDDAETGMPATVYLNGGRSGDMGHADPNDGDFFAYRSLAAAIKAGEKFE